ncbi:PhzF family phenazine biosynthesis protein [Kitasatospora sp. NBC_01287]|uniref:PhzF family phenazine biosynthesis protein n=1 Tax=Kitasatospora sp. NBC_01287 TaxID=2903573 RepID=UPI00224D61D5|nr:PhzF family phenazine biosynthesis isomerase [Kitasatospora sp. NBC_01287]MCX4750211.1 PhzF family phenazine biosynthesis protein [Kitasatospora sp. NBC_01287]
MTTVLRYAAFTTDPAGGNKAGVVPDATGLTDQRMLAIAAELGYSETAFLIADPSAGERTYRVRYFAPTLEVPFCGHATIAAAVAVADATGPGELVFETGAGTVPVVVAADGDGVLRATLTSVEPHVLEIGEADVAQALALLGWQADELDPTLPPRVAYAGARHLVLAARSRERLAELSYDFDGLAAFMTERELITLQLVWRESATVFHVRDPFPVGGVVEDPATGAAAAAFGAYLRELGEVGETAELTLHQGADLGSPGLLSVELRAGDPRVRVSGAGVRLPE